MQCAKAHCNPTTKSFINIQVANHLACILCLSAYTAHLSVFGHIGLVLGRGIATAAPAAGFPGMPAALSAKGFPTAVNENHPVQIATAGAVPALMSQDGA
jgi:hypothetical protein